jgi:hypothetical protein
MRDAFVKSMPDYMACFFEIVYTAEIMPQPKRQSRQQNSAIAATIVRHGVITG